MAHRPDPGYDCLPPAYATALRLRERGVPDDEIADRLGVDPAALPGLLDVAAAKLARSRAARNE